LFISSMLLTNENDVVDWLSSTDRRVTTMGMNKAQKQAAQRAKKTTAQEVQPAAEQPKPEAEQKPAATSVPAAAAPAQPSKQMQTIEKLKEGWTAKGVNLDKLTVKDDGKFKLVVVADGWPTVQIGPTGGISLPQIRSYAKAFDAAIDGLAVFEKQNAREAKKATATAPAPKAAAPEAVTA